MSAYARDYAYRVTIKDSKKPEPVISRKAVEDSKARVAQYLKQDKNNEHKI